MVIYANKLKDTKNYDFSKYVIYEGHNVRTRKKCFVISGGHLCNYHKNCSCSVLSGLTGRNLLELVLFAEAYGCSTEELKKATVYYCV